MKAKEFLRELWPLFLFLFVAVGGLGYGITNAVKSERRANYVITYKGHRYVFYKPINDTTENVMTFFVNKEYKWTYDFVNVGDTVRAKKKRMDKPICSYCYRVDGFFGTFEIRPTIERVNGRPIEELKYMAERDSIISYRDAMMDSMKQRNN